MNLVIPDTNPYQKDLFAALGDLYDVTKTWPDINYTNTRIPTLHIDFVKQLQRPENMRELAPNLWIDANYLLDWKYRVLLKTEKEDIFLITDRSCLEWLIWGIQLQLIQSDAVFVHAAGVTKNGKSILFPSWGGVGKTAIIAKFIRDLGWKLLGDDLVIVNYDGICYGFPKPMVLYPYHEMVFPEIFKIGKGPIAPIAANYLLGRVAQLIKPALRLIPGALEYARNHNPQSSRVLPSEAFGSDCLASAASLSTVVWLDRIKGIDSPQIDKEDSKIASRLAGSTLHEMDAWCGNLINVACGLGMFSFHSVYVQWLQVLEQSMRDSMSYKLYLPYCTSIYEVGNLVVDRLTEAGILS